MSGTLSISARIEALLFYKGEPVSVRFLAQTLNVLEDEVREGFDLLDRELKGRGVTLVRNGDEVMLGTAPVMGLLIERLIKEELSKDLGKAGLETLAIVLYRGPVARSDINYIRGVNSNYILRALMVRGLIEKDESSSVRGTVYRPTFELLSYLGVSKVEDLPEYKTSRGAVEAFEEEQENDNKEGEPDSEKV
ncbi:MAG: SMC-Scp complex subunit ScpB [Candidatus Yonathbacteria bacterium]|nr:SMC-Scp complex subunit ScpB [Candidatus Yonathbacteria bacterium]